MTDGPRTLIGPVTNASPIDVPGAASLCVQLPPQQTSYMVYRLSISGPSQSIAKVFVGAAGSGWAYRSISYFGQLDDADYPAGLYLPLNTPLTVVWYNVAPPASIPAPTNITNSAKGIATVLAEVAQIV